MILNKRKAQRSRGGSPAAGDDSAARPDAAGDDSAAPPEAAAPAPEGGGARRLFGCRRFD